MFNFTPRIDSAQVQQKVQADINNAQSKKISMEEFVNRVNQGKQPWETFEQAASIALKEATSKWFIIEWYNDSPEQVQSQVRKESKSKIWKIYDWLWIWIKNIVWGAVTQVPSAIKNIAWGAIGIADKLTEWAQWRNLARTWIDKLFTATWRDPSKLPENLLKDLSQSIIDDWVDTKEKLQEALWVDPDAFMTKAGEFITNVWGTMAIPLWSATKAPKIVQTGLANLQTKAPKLYNILTSSTLSSAWRWAVEAGKFGVVSEWETDWKEMTIWAAIPLWLQAGAKWVWLVTSFADRLTKLWLSSFWKFNNEARSYIEKNPKMVLEIVEELNKWTLSVKWLQDRLAKQFTTPEQLEKAKNWVLSGLIDRYRNIATEWLEQQIKMPSKFTQILDSVELEKKTIWKAFDRFNTTDVIWKSIQFWKDIFSKIPWTLWKFDKEAQKKISSVINWVWKWNITAEQARKIQSDIKTLARDNPSLSYIKRYATELDNFLETKIPWIKELSKEYQIISREVFEITNLLKDKTWNVRDTIFSMTKKILDNPVKLQKFKKYFWDDIVDELKMIQKWIKAEEAFKEVQKIKWISTFLEKLKTGTDRQREIMFKDELEKGLKWLISKEQQVSFINKIMPEELWFKSLKVWLDDINTLKTQAQATKNVELNEIADRLDIIRLLQKSDETRISIPQFASSVTQAKIWNVTPAIAFVWATSRPTLIKMYSKYYNLSSGIKKNLENAKNEELANFLERLFNYSVIEMWNE